MSNMTNPIDLNGKVAVVTGAAGGIGKAIVATLRRHGATVIGTDIRPCADQDPDFRILDVSNTEAIKAAAAEISSTYGGLHIWVNNAGMLHRVEAREITEATWARSIDVNLRSTVFACQAAAIEMEKHGGGAIVNLSSYAGLKARPNCIDYAVAKAGVDHATKCLALEFGALGIRVNCIAPGYIDTPMSGWMHEDPALKSEYLAKTPLRRLGTPEEIAMGVLYLVSPMSSFVTGHTVVIDGGIIHA
ncbi:SDR family NAD(P)-dependent oxidoreductase [Cupriavidus basilensis]|uniref:SDR family NAD(P)-dependent oxidoreductase n=1 Tax=Cupriavidus basilensis TaxID=68895 RepID=UPI0004470DF4|nr:SDR family oxidoreductase [Cupriavidus basilensis]MDF3883929.1 SDR family NAD(P)-dependent oxidoreductase [Cupriavidus basilensis]